ncbi:transposase [Reticulibacter mediterranei]|uniref:Transposase n=1 Tax=Reticulibacter mediterranei TaxID=2778369 RepID=A0A8J3N008_9CHLR|nr:IS982 family transposase [Reticulibacter mediterranei]GHO90760.1 transposase [Reticulibacter mediterranei]
MNLDDFIITCFCVIDEMMPMIVKEQRLRTRGPAPKLSDSEVITMEIIGSYLGLSQDTTLFAYFRRHYPHFFPGLLDLHRTSFVRQAANLWAIKERLWCALRDTRITYDECLSIVDSVPIPVCRFARAPWCVRFRGEASYGKDHADRQTFYGFRLHAQLSWPGLLTHVFLAPANEADGEIVPILLKGTTGVVLGDRNYWLPDVQAFLRTKGIVLQAPFRLAHSPKAAAYQSPVLGRVRYLIDTVFGQLTDRCQMKRVWARDLWHLRNRLLRCILMRTICFFLNQQEAAPYLQFDRLIA